MRTHQLETTLRSLALSGMLDTLEARLAQADAGELGHVEFLQALCEDELARRDAAGIARRVRAARFEQTCAIEDFDFNYNAKIPAARIRDLATLALRRSRRVGGAPRSRRCRQDDDRPGARAPGVPPGLHRGVHQDHRVCWPISPAATPIGPGRRACAAGPDRPSSSWTISRCGLHPGAVRRPLRADHRESRQESHPTANRAATDWYSLFPNPVVAESILDRVVNSAHHIHMDGKSYRPNKRPGRQVTQQ